MCQVPRHGETAAARADKNPVKGTPPPASSGSVRRFYREVTLADAPEGVVIHLDGKPVRTPARKLVALPTRQCAQLVADEFAAQGEVVAFDTMPVLRLVNSAIDGVARNDEAVREEIVRYASSDLICYRADAPEQLVIRQARAWDPVIGWAREALGARLILGEGVIHVEQPRDAIATIEAHLLSRSDPLRLAAIHLMTTLMGSALLALAVESGALGADAAWQAAHVDEDWNIDQWGLDAEAALRRSRREIDMMASARLLQALDQEAP